MAKVTGPLMSIEASGQFAQSIVFDKRGFARGYTIPSNPRTSSQQATRLAMKAAQTAAKHLNAAARTTLEGLLGYRWNAGLLADTLGVSLINWEVAVEGYENLTTQEKAALTALETTLGIQTIMVPEYEAETSGGVALYAVLCAYNRLNAKAAPVAVADIGTLFT